MKLSITIPAYNEEDTLEEIIGEAVGAGTSTDDDFEVLIVDDGSSDQTGRVADRLATETPNVRVVHHEHNRGFSGAMRSCVEEAAGDYIFLGPADGQAEFAELQRFWKLRDEYDLIFSCRAGRSDSVRRKLSSTVWYTFLRTLFRPGDPGILLDVPVPPRCNSRVSGEGAPRRVKLPPDPVSHRDPAGSSCRNAGYDATRATRRRRQGEAA